MLLGTFLPFSFTGAKQKTRFKLLSTKADEKFIPKWSFKLLPPREEIEGEPKVYFLL